MSLRVLLLGRSLRSEELEAQKIGPARGVPVLGLDALASAAYGPEAALAVLIALGAGATRFIEPISLVIIAVLSLVYISYRQTIAAYPGGGGSYTVASENLGRHPGVLAASALSLDYLLNVAVAISAGVGAIVSALPMLLPYTLWLCLGVLLLLTLANLRGVREAGLLFMLPTYLFLLCLGGVIVLGVLRVVLAHGHPVPVVRPAAAEAGVEAAGAWIVLRAFASGCTAMTGVEAVSNGVPLFREPRTKEAQRTLTVIIASLAVLLVGIAYLSAAFGITATPPGRAGYESVLSQLVAAVVGRGLFYYVTIGSIFAVLALSANTSFADFPRLLRVLAIDGFLPPEFAHPGRRLVYSAGIMVLALLAGLLLVIFRGVTNPLIPLFAVGAFLAFTLSQSGMVAHWRRVLRTLPETERAKRRHAARSMAINATGAVATGVTLAVVLASKFVEGAWITVLAIAAVFTVLLRIRTNEERLERATEVSGPLALTHLPPPIFVIPVRRLDLAAQKALQIALSISSAVQVVQVHAEEADMEDLRRRWREAVEEPAKEAGFRPPELVLLESPYREIYEPLLAHLQKLAREAPDRYIAVMVPELIAPRWNYFVLHSYRVLLLKWLLLLRGGPRVFVLNAPWYLEEEQGSGFGIRDSGGMGGKGKGDDGGQAKGRGQGQGGGKDKS
jgi:amino acid transporter